jgi:hypothetical protein
VGACHIGVGSGEVSALCGCLRLGCFDSHGGWTGWTRVSNLCGGLLDQMRGTCAEGETGWAERGWRGE